MADAAIQDRNAAAAKLLLQMNEMLTDKVDVVKTDATGLDREELDRRLAEFRARKESV
ncbi:hypothetical protein D3C76_1590360 [compost metagenome]